jgi:TetR/AcrR family transcriptional regulator, mexJK operon transcriptional repressor
VSTVSAKHAAATSSDDARPPAAPALRPSSVAKRARLLEAAEEVFVRDGYRGASVDEVAALAGVSKQTLYAQFGSKEALFVEVVTSLTRTTGDLVHLPFPDDIGADDVEAALTDYGVRVLTEVVTPRVMRLRRLVIGEVARFPDLARALYDNGPRRAITQLTKLFASLDRAGVLDVPDPDTSAAQFSWLVMAKPMNDAMLLGDSGIPSTREITRHAASSARLFVAAHRPSIRPGREAREEPATATRGTGRTRGRR